MTPASKKPKPRVSDKEILDRIEKSFGKLQPRMCGWAWVWGWQYFQEYRGNTIREVVKAALKAERKR